MKKSGVISLLLILCVIVTFFYVPYIEFLEPESKTTQEDQLLDYLDGDFSVVTLCLLTMFYPVLLIMESTIWGLKKSVFHRAILVIQTLLIGYGGFIMWFLMSFNIFAGPYVYKVPFYLIVTYLIIGVIWHILLVIPYFDDKRVSGLFAGLSLKQRE